MACQPVTGSSVQLPFVQESSDSLGTLSLLSEDVVIQILSKLPQPLEASLVCRKMSALARRAVEIQLQDKGLCTQALSEKWGVPITPECLALLLQFHVDVPALALKDTEQALKELRFLLDDGLNLLRSPKDLKKFLQDRLLANTLVLLEVFLKPDVFNEAKRFLGAAEEGFLGTVCSVKEVLSAMGDGASKYANLSSYSKRMESAIYYLSTLESGWREQLMLSAEETKELVFFLSPILPVRVFSLLPFELLQVIRRNLLRPSQETLAELRLEKVSIVPRGISSLDWLEILMAVDSSITYLPEEIGKMKLKLLALGSCDYLERLPLSLTEMTSLECVWINECAKLRPNDPVIEELSKKGVCIVWNKKKYVDLMDLPLSVSLRNYFV